MNRIEWKAMIEDAKQRVAQAESIAASVNRMADLKSYHSYAIFNNTLAERDLQTALRYDLPGYADASLPMPTYYVNLAQSLDASSREALAAAQRWAAATESFPSTTEQEGITPSVEIPPALPKMPVARSWTWGWILLGVVALGGGSYAAYKGFGSKG